MNANVTWKGRMTFEGTADTGFTLPLGADPSVGGDNDGFRPMELVLGMKNEKTTVHLNGRDFQIGIWIPELEINDVQVTINGKDTEILSFQKYYETGSSNAGCIAYIIQVKRSDEHGLTGKQTVMVSYEKTLEIGAKKRVVNSVGSYQFYLNFNGSSKYF